MAIYFGELVVDICEYIKEGCNIYYNVEVSNNEVSIVQLNVNGGVIQENIC